MTAALIAYPRIDPVLVHIGPLTIRWYGLAYVAAFIAAGFVIRWLSGKWRMGLSGDQVLDVVLASVAGVVIGGRLGYVLFYGLTDYLAHPLDILRIWDGGMSFHGGLIGILIAGWIVSRFEPVSFLRLADAGAVAAPIGLFFGRLANFINGELWGRPSNVPWAMVFPGAGPEPRHPSQLYEAGLEGLVLFAIMLLIARRKRGDGEQLGWFLTFYGLFRIILEFFRQPDVQLGFIAGRFTMGQLLSLPMIAVGVWLIVRARRRGIAEPHAEQPRPGEPG